MASVESEPLVSVTLGPAWWHCARTVALASVALIAGISGARATEPTDPPQCQTVRMSDIGWTDVTATTAVFSALLSASATSRPSRCCQCRSPTRP